jgi:hypothetical protein
MPKRCAAIAVLGFRALPDPGTPSALCSTKAMYSRRIAVTRSRCHGGDSDLGQLLFTGKDFVFALKKPQATDEPLLFLSTRSTIGERVMNWPEVESRWEEMKRLIGSYWKELSSDDLARIDRRRDGLAEVLRDRYGWDAQRTEAEICAFETDVRWPGAVK